MAERGSFVRGLLRHRFGLPAVLVVVLISGAAALAGTLAVVGRIGPRFHVTGNGRHLRPPGKLVKLGHFPTGGALTPDGHFYWAVSTGRALNDVRIIAVARKRPKVIQVLPIPGASGGIA